MTKDITKNIARQEIRLDLEIIANLIEKGAKVLDIGCGDGELLDFLVKNRQVEGRGIEISGHDASKAMMKGLSVVQGNAENDLQSYPDDSFDYAILSHTIQATRRPDKILQEMLRIADCAVVSLPNFANIKNRLHLGFKGVMPVSRLIPFEWYETPNIHFCSIADFRDLCQKFGFLIEKEVFLTNDKILKCSFLANLLADYAIFVIKKGDLAGVKNEIFVDEPELQAV